MRWSTRMDENEEMKDRTLPNMPPIVSQLCV